MVSLSELNCRCKHICTTIDCGIFYSKPFQSVCKSLWYRRATDQYLYSPYLFSSAAICKLVHHGWYSIYPCDAFSDNQVYCSLYRKSPSENIFCTSICCMKRTTPCPEVKEWYERHYYIFVR